jgi:hypothetical protein
VLVLSALNCGPRVSAPSPTPVACTATPPVTAHAFRADEASTLAGSYRFVLTSTTPGLRSIPDSGLLRLWVADSIHRHARRLPWAPGWRPLVPARQLTGVARMDDWSDPHFEGHDPDWSGAQVRGDTLLLGRELVNDYSPYAVVITGISPDAIWGRWHRDLGMIVIMDSSGVPQSNREGHFCAWRVARDSTASLVPADV